MPILGHGSWRQEGGRNWSGRGGGHRFWLQGGEELWASGGIGLEKSSKWAQKENFFWTKKILQFFRQFCAIIGGFFRKIPQKFLQSRGRGWLLNKSLTGRGTRTLAFRRGVTPPSLPPCPCMTVPYRYGMYRTSSVISSVLLPRAPRSHEGRGRIRSRRKGKIDQCHSATVR